MDSDLAESLSAIKTIFKRRRLPLELTTAPASLVEELRKSFRIPPRYRTFLTACNPARFEAITPTEHIRLFPAEELAEEQRGFSLEPLPGQAPSAAASTWKKSWIVIGRSSLLGDPYFLDTSRPDAEGDCPVCTAMSGKERWEMRLCASSFVQFLQILAVAMEVAIGFGDAVMDMDDEAAFREALGPKIKPIDVHALRAGHWT